MTPQHLTDFRSALARWKDRLSAAGYSADVVWRFRGELTIMLRRKAPDGGFVLSYAHEFLEIQDRDAERLFGDLRAKGQPIVFQLLAAGTAYSLCTLAFDPWESEEEDYCAEDGVYYSIDAPYSEAEAITSRGDWIRHCATQSKSISGLDFVPHCTVPGDNKLRKGKG